MFLLDTTVCIDFTTGRSDRLRAQVRERAAQGLAISTITLAELRLGACRPGADPADIRRLDIFASALAVREFDRAAADSYGRLARQVRARRNSFDRLIAAHALSLDLTLVTNDERDFDDVPGLRVENWTA